MNSPKSIGRNRDQIPPGLRKSGIPDSVLIPAPVKNTMRRAASSSSRKRARSGSMTLVNDGSSRRALALDPAAGGRDLRPRAGRRPRAGGGGGGDPPRRAPRSRRPAESLRPIMRPPPAPAPAGGRVASRSSRNGISRTRAKPALTARSPRAQVVHGSSVPANASEKKRAVSRIDPSADEASGACHHFAFRSRSNTCTSASWAMRKALPEAAAIRGVASHAESATAHAKPARTTRRAPPGPKRRLVRSVTRKANG